MLIIISTFITILISFLIYYKRPLKYKKDTPIQKDHNKKKEEIHKKSSFLLTTNLIKKGEIQVLKGDAEIKSSCIILKGLVNVLYNNELICQKAENSLILYVKHAKIIANEETEIICVDSIDNYLYFLLTKKQVKLYCNFFKQTSNLLKYEQEHFSPNFNLSNIPSISNEMMNFSCFEKNFEVYRNLFSDYVNTIFKIKTTSSQFNINFIKERESIDSNYLFIILQGSVKIKVDEDKIIARKNNIIGFFNAYFGIAPNYRLTACEDSLILYINKLKINENNFNKSLLYEIDPLFELIEISCTWLRYDPGDFLSIDSNHNICFIEQGKMIKNTEQSKTDNDISENKFKLPAKIIENFDFNFTLYNNVINSKHEYFSGSEIGKIEAIVNIPLNLSLMATKTTDLLILQKNLLFFFLKTNHKFAISFTKNLFLSPKRKIGKTITIILSDESYKLFFSRLKEIFFKENVLFLYEKDIVTSFHENMFKFYNYLSIKEQCYDLIILLFNTDSIYSKQFIKYSDVLLCVGSRVVSGSENYFCSVELVNIYKSRFYNKEDDNFFAMCKRKFIDKESNQGFRRKQTNETDNKNTSENENPGSNNNIRKNSEGSNNSSTSDPESKEKQSTMSKNNRKEFEEENKQIFIKYNKIHHVLSPSHNNFSMKDFERLKRSLLGKRIGLVLGGGGARGLAHIGIIQALEEEGIPIDLIGGTSMGAFIGALYARNCENISVFRDSKKLCNKMNSKWRQILDLTYPICSVFSGHAFNRILYHIFKDTKIEDLWIDYFCVTTNISTFDENIHKKGTLWRYVRASMSLSGYLPPLCDLDENNNLNLLLDGGYMNNVPADAMLDLGVNKIIAIDVGSSVINDHYNYGDSINGFVALFQKFFRSRRYLSLNEIQYRLAYLGTQKKMKSFVDEKIILLRPEIDGYKTMDFNKFEEIVACGYTYGKKIVREWKKEGKHRELLGMQTKVKRRFSI